MAKKTTSKKRSNKVTPLMEQYFNLKSKHPDAILLFRVGDFYETFGEDAVKAADVLGIVLTSRNNGGSDIPLAGFPYHSVDVYLPKLVRAGFRVAVCEQLEKPSKEKKIVKRGVTDVITPGLTIDDGILDRKNNNYLASIQFGPKNHHGVSFIDISTGEFLLSEGNLESIEKLIHSFGPAEIIYSKSFTKEYTKRFGDRYYSYPLDEWIYSFDYCREKLLEKFDVPNLKGFGVEKLDTGQIAAGSALHYLSSTQNENLKHIRSINRIQSEEYVWLDRFTIRNLELVSSVHETGIPLIQVLDKTVSPMGARMLRKWVLLPLMSVPKIEARLDMVSHFYEHTEVTDEIEVLLRKMGDLERLVSKISMMKVAPRELLQLKKALINIDPLKKILTSTKNEHFEILADKLHLCESVRDKIEHSIHEEPPSMVSKGGTFKDGYNKELDELNNIVRNSKELLLGIQVREAEKTGITNLKIGFNNVFGYYLEVTNKYKNQGLIPDDWVRKQTLTNAERYITDELKQLETKILGAQDKILGIEEKLYEELLYSIIEYLDPIQTNAFLIANVDCILSFSRVAQKFNYSRPTVNDSTSIDIVQGRHPVIEQHMKLDETYVPNDISLSNDDTQLMMITGPNMSGKSAILRQTALISLMAQMGSFVPAQSATIGIIDKLFTRVGASDNISSGESTFMLEMNETASIMNNISPRSLILLDEIGRGTSTYDGISIAWSLAEYLHNNKHANPKTLFATHYHELNELANKYPRVKNYNVATKEVGQKVIFLRKLVPGGSKHSFGIHVARMAGMPIEVLKRANEILKQLELKSITEDGTLQNPDLSDQVKQIEADPYQLSIFETVDPIAGKLKQELSDIQLNSMTPIECMMKLNELKKLLEEE
ncbi:MAG: DNA mismatch repair protein MutS [Saprospiraceae bacterium]|nr:DNA mismatch repair protein MutS [Saprospiraceae bacterium]